MRAVVIGGSLGGLTAALVLRDTGWDVHVVERSGSTLTGRGVGIVVQPATVRYLVERQVVELEQVSTSARRLRYLERDGRPARDEPCTYRFTAWNTLYRTLLGCLEAGRYQLGDALAGLAQDAGQVEVRLSSGRRELCDLLVCADGASSTARGLLLPEVRPTYAGYVGWRGTVPEADLSPGCRSVVRDAILYHLMPSSHILAYPIPAADGAVDVGRRLLNFVWYRNVAAGADLHDLMRDRDGVHRDMSLPPGAVRERFVRQLSARVRDLGWRSQFGGGWRAGDPSLRFGLWGPGR